MKKIFYITTLLMICFFTQLKAVILQISADITITQTIYLKNFQQVILNNSISITNNSTLTIDGLNSDGTSCNTWFSVIPVDPNNPNGYTTITIEPGSTLILNGAKIALEDPGCQNSCWGGIIVQGNSGSDQTQSGNRFINQGYLILKNGALITNAQLAIDVMGGGVVRASNTTVQNCYKGVRFEMYQNPTSNTTNKSCFNLCNFIIDAGLKCTFSDFAELDNVQGVSFYGCNFTVTDPAYIYTGIGIKSYNSSFIVQKAEIPLTNPYSPVPIIINGDCVPAPNGAKNIFTNLNTAISIDNSLNSSRIVKINENEFDNNSLSVLCFNDNSTLIYGNTFNYNNDIPGAGDATFLFNNVGAIYTFNSQKFKILQNTFNWNITNTINKYYYGVYSTFPDQTNLCRVKDNIFNNSNINNDGHIRGALINNQRLASNNNPADIKYVCNNFTNISVSFEIDDDDALGIVSQLDDNNSNANPPFIEAGNKFNSSGGFLKGIFLPKITYFTTSDPIKQPFPSYPFYSVVYEKTSNVILNECSDISLCDIYGKLASSPSELIIPNTVNYENNCPNIVVRADQSIQEITCAEPSITQYTLITEQQTDIKDTIYTTYTVIVGENEIVRDTMIINDVITTNYISNTRDTLIMIDTTTLVSYYNDDIILANVLECDLDFQPVDPIIDTIQEPPTSPQFTNINLKQGFSIYPNPVFSDNFNFEYSIAKNFKNAHYEILNSMGQSIKIKEIFDDFGIVNINTDNMKGNELYIFILIVDDVKVYSQNLLFIKN